MAIGTSLGAYFDDAFHHQAGINTDPSQDHIDVDPEVDDQSTKPKPKLDIMKVSDVVTADDTAATMASQASEKATDALKSSRGTLPSLDSDTGIKGDVIIPASETARKLGIDTAITSEDRDTATSIAMAASGGGLSVEGGGVKILQGIPQIGRKPANQNIPDLYNPRDPSMIGSHELDTDMDAAWKSMGDKHARLDAIRQERNGINKVREDRDWSDIDLAKYNKLGAEANKLMGEDFFSKVDVKLKKYMTQEELDKMVDELAASRAEQSKSIDKIGTDEMHPVTKALQDHFHETVTIPHEEFIKDYDKLHEYGNFLTEKGNWTEMNLARYNKMGREMNEKHNLDPWEDLPFDPLKTDERRKQSDKLLEELFPDLYPKK